MLIYIFAEHYPNPYKPQFDTEFAYFLRQGHEIEIFVSGQYTSTVHQRVRSCGLDRKTFLFPTTLKTLPRFLGTLIFRVIRSPRTSIQRIFAGYDSKRSVKKNFLRAARMLILPDASPDLCYIHNLATIANFDFLHQIYPSSRVIAYFHGGEVGGVRRIVNDIELFGLMQVVFCNTNFCVS